MSEHYWRTHWNGREYVMDDTGRVKRVVAGQPESANVLGFENAERRADELPR